MRSEIEEIEDLSYRSPYAYPLSHLEFSEYAESPIEPSHAGLSVAMSMLATEWGDN